MVERGQSAAFMREEPDKVLLYLRSRVAKRSHCWLETRFGRDRIL